MQNLVSPNTATMLATIIMLLLMIAIFIGPLAFVIYFIRAASKGKNIYTAWTILTVILCVISLAYGIASGLAEIITYIVNQDKQKKQSYKHEPGPGSTADYERWRAEQEQKKP